MSKVSQWFPKPDFDEFYKQWVLINGEPHLNNCDQFAKDVILAHQAFQWDKFKGHCGVCGCLISNERKYDIRATDFNVTCEDHDEFREVFQIDVALERKGLPIRSFILESFFKS